ncbi:RagB/SusD family nutrient uptake outer membrane protein [Marinilabilia salmonicolor]|uniref:Putative outer membrane starch-binding protein n=1 Tax=Marinilabilia salmonicolor TaxID=989 RepID=A0A368UUM4_9BACT|nr:RagB/SusD family nutrient uptake outer membrane protein [Marinilabilia salmonicolor]RCW32539.1 putative outer membrane starch-binding protein [Marinilabilia salmonicolor]
MNKIKYIVSGMLALSLMLGINSCSDDFLNEELTTAYSTDYYDTQEGLNDLAVALYGNIRYHYAYEWAYGTTNYGTDEFSVGTDLTSEMWNNYDSRLAPYVSGAANKNYPSPSHLWDQMYYGINSANIIINSEEVFTDADLKQKCLGEAHFLRGYNYLRLAMQYGGVVLKLEPTNTVERYFERNSAEETVAQIVSDLQAAYDLLPEEEFRGKGTFTKPLAAHMLAKALLFRCSERNDEWNSTYVDADLDQIITLSDYVITARPLASDYGDIWDWTGVDCEAELLPEILMAAQFNADASTSGRFMNRTFCYPIAQYSNLPLMSRTVAGGLDFQRLRTTEYGCNVFDRVNDSRFWKSFKTKYRVNNAGDNEYGIENGDLGVLYIINNKDDNRFDVSELGEGSFSYVDPNTGKVVPNVFVNYSNGEWTAQNSGNNRFVSLSKYEDGSRTALKAQGNRDGVLARTGETYLIKAEALVRQGNFQQAIEVVNELRARAEFDEGEDRAHHADGSQAANGGLDEPYDAYTNRSSYYESNNIPETTAASDLQIDSYTSLPAVDEAILNEMGITGDYNRMLHFILNERSRELFGEFLRWDDLARTETLIVRAKTFNDEASENVDEHHFLRPIPQSFIDGLTNDDGSELTAEQKSAMQNPGY